jgi:hypothetical protein
VRAFGAHALGVDQLEAAAAVLQDVVDVRVAVDEHGRRGVEGVTS